MASDVKFTVTGKNFIEIITRRLNDNNIRCYDSAIVQQISKLTSKELMQAIHFGDVQKWHNDRTRSDYKDKD